jgi:hypothetical protein
MNREDERPPNHPWKRRAEEGRGVHQDGSKMSEICGQKGLKVWGALRRAAGLWDGKTVDPDKETKQGVGKVTGLRIMEEQTDICLLLSTMVGGATSTDFRGGSQIILILIAGTR